MHTILIALHVIGSGIMLGVVFTSLIIVFKKTLSPESVGILKRIQLFGTVGAIWQTITGLILFFQEKEEFIGSSIFWVKMGLFILDGVLAVLIIGSKIRKAEAQAKGQTLDVSNVPLWAMTSVVIISTIIILGVFLAETH